MSHDHLPAELAVAAEHDQLGRRSARRALSEVAAGHGRAARPWLLLSSHAAQALAEQPTVTAERQRMWHAVAAHRARVADECREVVMPR